ncbi:unnamed protein product [Mytilus edulis]|uniref:Uncharacterized protein n=1 Tax=Mytilus edulis TaxID=6550 RepID=A0A8S3S340_MYTED|nr:unnamed protein product [Mytilus edulis]
MSIENHLYPVKADSKRNEESLHLKQQLYTVDMHLELDNKHVSLHQLLKMQQVISTHLTGTGKPNTEHVNIHHKFTDILDDHGLAQLVEEPTKDQTCILDLILTNYPESFSRTEIILGISDHDIEYTEVNKIPTKIHQKPREVPLYKKAKWENIENDLKKYKLRLFHYL